MSMTLRGSEARAIDLILDRAATAQGSDSTSATVFAGQSGVSAEQIAAAAKVLKLLDAMPAAEPSPDLLLRTLDRVAACQNHSSSIQHPGRDLVDANRPHA